jgi:TIR domain/Kelch motif
MDDKAGSRATGTGSEPPRVGGSGVRVFVSYRRDDVPDATDRLATSLVKRLGKDQVFLDVDSIDIGAPFAKVVGSWIDRCDALLAVIGRSWLDAKDDEGRRRLENPHDYVRLEIEAGLDRDVRVVPVLIHGTRMPKSSELPESLVPLLDRNAVELSRAHWEFDVDRLVAALDRIRVHEFEGETAKKGGIDDELAAGEAGERATPQPETTATAATENQDAEARAAAREAAERGSPRVVTARSLRRRSPWLIPVLAVVVLAAVLVVLLIPGTSSPPGSPAWQRLPDLLRPVLGAGVSAYRGEVWVAGGCSNPTGGCGNTKFWLRSVYVYNPRTGAWRSGPSLPAARNFTALVSDGSHLYAIGGDGPPSGQAQATVFRLDRPSGQWQTDTSLPDARGAGAAAWDGKRIVFAGGDDSNRRTTADVWTREGGQWNRIGQLQQARKHLAAASDQNGTVWFAGGSNDADSAYPLVDVVKENSVTPGQPLDAVKGSVAVALGSGFCTIGGATQSGPTGEVQCQPHHSVPALDPPRNYVGATVLDNKLYVVGGFDAGHFGGLPTAEVLDTRGIR